MIQLIHVSKSFGDKTVLQDVNAEWEQGKIHGLIGQNGSGKTVLLKCICGLMRYDSGTILIDHKQIGKDIQTPDDLGLIIESPGFISRMSGYRNLKMLASLRNRCDEEGIQKAMEKVHLDWQSKKSVSHYSMGMKQRLGIAQAIMEDPKLLILDEPFNGLDRQGTAEIRALLKEQRTMGKTILVVSHNPLDIDELCDTVTEIDAGKVSRIQ